MTLTAKHVETVLRSIPYAWREQNTGQLAAGANEALRSAPAGLTKEGAAAFLATLSQESGAFRYLEEIDKTQPYSPYIGRGYEQVTHRSNYAAFGVWCKARGLISDADYFVKNPSRLADIRWAWLGGVWFWQANNIWKYGNKGDFLATQQAVNLGSSRIGSKYIPSGIAERRKWYAAWLKIGSALLPTESPSTPAPTAPEATVPLSQTKRKEWKNSGKYVDERTHAQLEAVEEILGHPIVMYQGSWSDGSLSADTHAGAGAADVGPPSRELETACRKVGLATWWRRGSAWKNNEHCHALSIGNSHLASWAKVQVAAYKAGYDGLGGNARAAKDTGNRSYVNVTWEKVEEEYGMPTAQEVAKEVVKQLTADDKFMDTVADTVLSRQAVVNEWDDKVADPADPKDKPNTHIAPATSLRRQDKLLQSIKATLEKLVPPTPPAV